MRLFLGIPTSGSPTKPFLESLAQLEMPASVSSVDRGIVTGNFVPAQRELIVRRALARGADRLLMCDDDMILPPDALAKLSAVLDNDAQCALAGALYYSRDGFRPMAVDDWSADDTTGATIPAFADAPVAVDGVGFGCVLVRVDSLRFLTQPYFSAQIYIEPAASRVRVCNEDYLFCASLRAQGFRIVLHGGVRCGHYDRWSGRTYPEQWEAPSVTSQRRMAAAIDGEQKLVAFVPAQRAGEAHESVAIEYIWPEN